MSLSMLDYAQMDFYNFQHLKLGGSSGTGASVTSGFEGFLLQK